MLEVYDMDNWLDRIVKCPKCNNDVRDGDRIWLNGECLCPQCYTQKRKEMDYSYLRGYEDGKNSKN